MLNPPWSTIGVPASSPRPTINGDIQAWQLVFEDDFDGDALDSTKWDVLDGWSNQNGATSLASNVSVDGSVLSLQLSDSTHGAAVAGPNVASDSLDAGAMLPVGSYTEARCYFPGQAGSPCNWPAFWLAGGDWGAVNYCELDVFEADGSDATCNYHSGDGNGDSTQSGPFTVPGDWTNAWHVFGVLRTAASLEYYWDGTRVYTTTPTDTPGVTLPARFTLGYDSSSGSPLLTGPAGAMKVDWIRAWIPAGMERPVGATNELARYTSIDGDQAPSSRFARTYDWSLSGPTTVQAVANGSQTSAPPNVGDQLTLIFRQDITGFSVTFAADYKLISGASIPTTASTVSQIDFEYDGTSWRQTGPVVTTPA